MSMYHRETVEWKRAFRDVEGLRETIARAFRDLGTLDLSPTDRLVIRNKIEAMTADLNAQLEMFTGRRHSGLKSPALKLPLQRSSARC